MLEITAILIVGAILYFFHRIASSSDSKLVRDKTRSFFPDDTYTLVAGDEYFEFLKKKLDEELEELEETDWEDDTEWADVLTVLEAIMKHKNIDKQKVFDTSKAKLERSGGFETGLVWHQ
jgi:predicted house-cleaning noncanonical NTP pyrophosphatase (MazG superfamily)